jgi:hypothetical protein
MVDLKLQVPTTGEVEVDAQASAAINEGFKAADEGAPYPSKRCGK